MSLPIWMILMVAACSWFSGFWAKNDWLMSALYSMPALSLAVAAVIKWMVTL